MPKPIHLYRPQRTDPEDLEKVFTGREPFLDEILGQLRSWQPGRSRQHHLIIGPRGIGKTAFLRIVEHRVRCSPELNSKWAPVFPAEDNYSLTSVADLLLEALRLLAVNESSERLDRSYQQVRHDPNNERVVDLVLDAFRRFHSSSGKSVLLMLENVNRVFERQMKGRSEIPLLRKLLTEEEWLLLVCTSPTYLKSVTRPEEPLFEFFRPTTLEQLSPDEQKMMLCRLAAQDGNSGFETYVEKYRSRLRALYHFTGGNPRLTIMLYSLISHQAITDVQSELDLLLDELSPFYQDRMRDMSEQEAKVLETMALLPEGCTPTELATEARMGAKTVRALISRLGDAGYVRAEQRREKKTIYILPERFFRIWHQMNHSRATRGRLRYLLEFFSSWYATRDERDQVWAELTQEFELGAKVGDDTRLDDLSDYMGYVAAVSEGGERYKRELDHARQAAGLPDGESLESSFARLDTKYEEDGDYFLQKGYLLANDLRRHAEALPAFQRAFELKRDAAEPMFNKAIALDKLGNHSQARSAYRSAAALLASEGDDVDDVTLRAALLGLLKSDHDRQRVWLAARLLGRVYEESVWEEISVVLKEASNAWRRRHCATALGLTGAFAAAPVLTVTLGDDAPDVRGSAATALGRIGTEEAIQPLIDCLQDPASDVRGSAATALGRIGAEEAVQPLIDCLQDPASNVRGSAPTALGRIGAKEAIQPLIDCLQDPDGITRSSAATALGRIGTEEAIQPLIDCLQDPDGITRSSAATALGRIGTEEAIQPLIDCLQEPADNVRGSAAAALGRIGAEEAIQPLIGCLQDPDGITRGSAATALGRIDLSHGIPELGRIFWLIIDSPGPLPETVLNARIESLLRSCLRAGNLQVVQELLTEISERLPDSSAFCLPYVVAADYLRSNGDPAVLERQQPEMREAAQLVIDAFEETS